MGRRPPWGEAHAPTGDAGQGGPALTRPVAHPTHVDDPQMTDDFPYTIRRSTRARRVRVNVHAHAGVEVVLPERASERAAAAAVAELRPWIERRLGEAREPSRAWPSAAPRCPTWARPSSWSRRPVARGCTVAASACSSPRATRGRRSSASTAAPLARRSARAWTGRRRSWAPPTADSRSARSARVGPRARRGAP